MLDYIASHQYAYYSCSGRRTSKTKCTRRAIPVAVAEQLVADCYARISINEAQYVGLAKKVGAAFDERFASRSDELADLAANRRRLEDESDKLLAAHFADAIDLITLKRTKTASAQASLTSTAASRTSTTKTKDPAARSRRLYAS